MKLYNLTEAYQLLLDNISNGEEGMEGILETLEDAIDNKLESIAKVIKTLEGEVTVYKQEEKRLADRRRSIENNIKRLKAYAEESLESVGKDKVKGELFTIAMQKNPPSVVVHDESIIPEGFFVPQPPTLNKRELLAVISELKDGNVIKGAELVQKRSLRIR